MVHTKKIYSLPFYKKDLIKASSHPKAHFAHFRYAIDFLLPRGSVLLAARDGEVIDVKVDSNQGGADPKYNDVKYLNYLTIRHGDGEFSQYAHLKSRGALVKVGEKVKTGQPVAFSGNTGFSTEPHLHFQVFKLTNTPAGWETLEVRLKEKIDIDTSDRPIPKKYAKLVKEVEKIKKALK